MANQHLKFGEKQSLLQQEDFEQKVNLRVQRSGRGAVWALVTFGALMMVTGVVLLILSYTVFPEPPFEYPYDDWDPEADQVHFLYNLLGIVFICVGPVFACTGGCVFLVKMRNTEVAGQMFGSNLIGYFVYDEGERWRAFAEHQYNLSSKTAILGYVVSFIFIACGAIPFGIFYDGEPNKGVLFAYSWIPFIGVGLFFLILILSVTQYQRFRRFRPEVHCTVLSRGCFYSLGELYILQHTNAAESMLLFNLTGVRLTRLKKNYVDMPIFTITGWRVNHKGHRIPLHSESPVPENMTGAVVSWLGAFSEPLGVRAEADSEFITRATINRV